MINSLRKSDQVGRILLRIAVNNGLIATLAEYRVIVQGRFDDGAVRVVTQISLADSYEADQNLV
jgi:hypothetical protein